MNKPESAGEDYAPKASDQFRIVDAHHHLWNIEGHINYPWLTHDEWTILGDYSALKRTYLPPELRRDAALHRLVGSVAVEAECDRFQQVEEAAWFSAVGEQHGLPDVVVAHAWVDTDRAEEILAKLAGMPRVRGVRTKPRTSANPDESVRGQPRSMQDPKWLEGLKLLQKYGLSFDLRLPWWHLEEGAEVAAALPDLPITLNHTGYPLDRSPEALEVWRRGMYKLAQLPNVHCKVSGLCVPGEPWTYESNAPIIRDTIAAFGFERCMFASNFPVDSLKITWDRMYASYKRAIAHMPVEQQQAMLADNAIRFYRMDL